jgi:hypothetical protein
MGRFDVDRVDPDFVQYGGHGVPMLYEDIRQVTLPEVEYEYNGLTGTEARTAFWEDALARVPALLAYRYGEFFTGSDPAAADALLRRAPASTAPWWQ